MSLELHPLTKNVGIEVRGVDLRNALEPGEVAVIRAAWEQYGVLVFSDQQLTMLSDFAGARLLSVTMASSEGMEARMVAIFFGE